MKYYSTIKTHLWYTKCHVCISKPLCCTEEGKQKRNHVLPHFYEVNKSNHGDRYKEKDSFGVLRVVKQSMDWLEKVTKEPSGMREMFYVLIGGMVTWA